MPGFAFLFPQLAPKLHFDHFWGTERKKTMHFVNRFIRPTVRSTLLALAGVLLASAPLSAQAARIDVRTLTCQQAVSLVQSRGAVVFTLTDRTYDRIVSNRFLCGPSEMARDVITATSDAAQCKIGKRCLPGEGPFNDPLEDN
jgi:hypothetical protein